MNRNRRSKRRTVASTASTSVSTSNSASSNESLSPADFLKYLDDLGLERPADLKEEHLEHMFNDPDTVRILKHLMSTLSIENVCDEKELAMYQKLEKEGRVLHGKDLEKAMNLLEEQKGEDDGNTKEFLEIEKDLDDDIAAAKSTISNLKHKEQLLNLALEENIQRNSNSDENKQKHIQRRIELENLINKEQIQLAETITKVEEFIREKFYNKEKLQDYFISFLNWDQILAREQSTLSKIKECFTNQGNLLGGSDDLDKELQNLECDFKRLKHSLSYEQAIDARFQIEKVGLDAQASKLPSLVNEANKLATNAGTKDISKILKNLESENKEIGSQLQGFKSLYLKKWKRYCVIQVEKKIENIGNAVDYNGEFFQAALEALTVQNARLNLLHAFLKNELKTVNELLMSAKIFQDTFRELDFGAGFAVSSVQQDCQEETMICKSKARQDWEQKEKELKSFDGKYQLLKKEGQNLTELFNTLKKSFETKSEEEKAIEDLEEKYFETKSQIEYLKINQDSITQSSVQWKQDVWKQMKELNSKAIEPRPVFVPKEKKFNL